ncbi:response regulator [Mongoliitalea daihaiensis]|uniref:response regulator n=1 Tax=Mongoliitalea daihaiensis TaxID=2782006 RepID=UPI001F405928|nr:response regulator [Mongoliitalea daihaiensis]UJP64529.1 response regulator [Mongoliitalea daihaiensis]
MNFDILIVDDRDIDLMLLSRIVKKVFKDYQPWEYMSGIDALKEIHESTQLKDTILVLLDINMPSFSGWDFLEMLNENLPARTVHVCIVTSSVNISDKKLAEKYPQVFNFLEKPVTLQDMEQLVSNESIFRKS